MSKKNKAIDVSKYSISVKNKVREISFSGKMNDWEKKFVTNKQVIQNPSKKQLALIDKMYKDYVLKRYAR